MLHLLPIRLLFQASLIFVAIAIAMAFYAGLLDPGESAQNAASLVRIVSFITLGLSILVIAAWRWVPAVQRFVFPYLGGEWTGVVKFPEGSGEGRRRVTLEVKHTPLGLKLVLDSDESTSWTLSVQADRNPDFQRYRLFYIYQNERKEGVRGAGEHYRGVAIMRVETGRTLKLLGNYFTETDRRGTIELTAKRLHPFWKLWR